MFKVLKSLSKHTVIYGLGDLMAKGISLILIPLYTHYLSPANYGLLDLLELTTFIIGLILAMGIAQSVTRYYYEYDDQKRKDQVVSMAMYTIWTISAIALPILIYFSAEVSDLVLNSTEYSKYYVIIFISMLVNLSNEIPLTLMRIRQQSTLYITIALAKLTLNLTLNIVLLVVYDMGVMAILISAIISQALMGIFLIGYMLKHVKLSWSWPILKEMIKYSIPMAWTWFGMFFMNYGDRFLLQRFDGLESVGIYSLAYKFGMVANMMVLTPFLMTWWPKQFEIVKEPNAKETYSRVFTYFLLVLVYCSLGIAILIKDTVDLIAAPEYYQAYQYVPVILLSYISYGMYNYVQFGIHLKKKTKYLGISTLIVAAANFGLNFWLIPIWGIWGATIATGISFALLTAVIHPIAQRLYKIPYQYGRIVQILLVAGGMFYLCSLIDLGSAMANLTLKFILALSYPLVLTMVGFFDRDELDRIKSVLKQIAATIKPWLGLGSDEG